MEFETRPVFLDHIVRTTHMVAAGKRSALYRAVASGALVQLASGVYLPRGIWRDLDPNARYLARVHAASGHLAADRLHSHLTAAALWKLPMIDSWPSKSHVIARASSSGSVRAHHVIHAVNLPNNHELIDGLRVTSLARTVVDVASTSPMSVAVAMADRAISAVPRGARSVLAERTTLDELWREARLGSSARGSRKCSLALSLADGKSGSPGESLSRVAIHVLGFPPPVLQQEFCDHEGRMYADFWWPEFNLVGEFDGYGKYLKEELLAGKSTAEAVLAEKRREDRIRALGPSVTRWDWPTARSLPSLDAQLVRAGLRRS